MIHVALNLVFLVPGEIGGMEVYARELLPALAARDDIRVTSLINEEAAAAGPGPWHDAGAVEVVPVHARNRVEWVRGEQQHVPRIAKRVSAEVVHSLASTGPVWGSQKRVTTIHDINYLVVPDAHFGVRGLGMRALVPAAAHRSARIIVDAESTKRDLAERLRVKPSKVDVAPLAAAPPAVDPTPEAELRERLALRDRRVVLSPGAKRPHKNLITVIAALGEMPAAQRPVLVAPGYATPYEEELRAAAREAGLAADELIFPEWLDAADLEGLYALASVVAFVSLYEGFGFPVLEAMQRGVPVVTSDRASLPEVAGDAALTVEPTDTGAVRGAITRVLDDPDLATRLAAAGREQAAKFSWERTAELTAQSYARALREP